MNLAAAFNPVPPATPPLYPHQAETVAFLRTHPEVMNHSACGTGKCRSYLEALREHRDSGGGAALVLTPKTILQSAWAADAERFTPELKASIATAENRRHGLKPGADLYLLNHDAVRTLAKDPTLLPPGLDSFCVDESTALKSLDQVDGQPAYGRLQFQGLKHVPVQVLDYFTGLKHVPVQVLDYFTVTAFFLSLADRVVPRSAACPLLASARRLRFPGHHTMGV